MIFLLLLCLFQFQFVVAVLHISKAGELHGTAPLTSVSSSELASQGFVESSISQAFSFINTLQLVTLHSVLPGELKFDITGLPRDSSTSIIFEAVHPETPGFTYSLDGVIGSVLAVPVKDDLRGCGLMARVCTVYLSENVCGTPVYVKSQTLGVRGHSQHTWCSVVNHASVSGVVYQSATIEIRMRYTSLENSQALAHLFAIRADNESFHTYARIWRDLWEFQIQSKTVPLPAALDLTEWNHFALSWSNAGTAVFYVNGVKIADLSGLSLPGTTQRYLSNTGGHWNTAASWTTFSHGFDPEMQIGQIGHYQGVLSDANIALLAESTEAAENYRNSISSKIFSFTPSAYHGNPLTLMGCSAINKCEAF